ncbi:Pycsar system effector family protein [Robertkochia sediminum]|uniref:Pycsar system effector family protein n=1 Tax=Robertkochia sediminum TaxID=2785326 RepID=UPI0019321F37|nr:Pycsar system effector family protein [Robertkochia sediminum]MBL7473989.1 HD domain-containing protein [Robertkochia sediminum]
MSELVQRTQDFVTDLLINKLDPNFLYHNLRHTQRVVKNTKVLIENAEQLSTEEQEDLLLAAWLHDTGYVSDAAKHEAASCVIAREVLQKEGLDPGRVDRVCDMIMATNLDIEPVTLPQKILRDADCSHLGRPSFADTSELLRLELLRRGEADYSPGAWREENIKLLSAKHHYYTPYAMELWQAGKDENLKALLEEEKKEAKKGKKEKLKAKYKYEYSDRGVQTMYRIALNNHLRLSSIADTKANILLSVNAIIISVALSNLIPKLDNPSNKFLVIPTMVLLFFSVISIIFAIMATRPNITTGKFTEADVKAKKVNLLFFGTFFGMPYDQYREAISELIHNNDDIYEALTRDLYNLGLVLGRKYKLLRMTYTVFLIGTIISVVSFIMAYVNFANG